MISKRTFIRYLQYLDPGFNFYEGCKRALESTNRTEFIKGFIQGGLGGKILAYGVYSSLIAHFTGMPLTQAFFPAYFEMYSSSGLRLIADSKEHLFDVAKTISERVGTIDLKIRNSIL